MGRAQLSYQCGLPDSAFTMVDGKEFCSQCHTSIVDFTGMTDEEIRSYVSAQTGSFCVKIHSDQLQRVKGRKSSLRQNIAVAATATLLAVTAEANAQVSDSVRTEQVQNSPANDYSSTVSVASDTPTVASVEQGMTLNDPVVKRGPVKKKVFLRLSRREFYVMNRAPFIGSRRRGGWRGKF